MSWLKRRARWIVSGWLIGQAAVFAVSPAAICRSASDPSAAVATCTCTHAANQPCPMHRHAPAKGSSSDCACRSTANPDAAALTALLGPVAAIAPAAEPGAATPHRSPLFLTSRRLPHDVAIAPDGPPPRA